MDPFLYWFGVAGCMERNRPFLANYAIGFLVVMSMYYFYEALVFYCFSEVIEKTLTGALVYADTLVLFVIAGFVLALLLVSSSRLGYYLALPTMAVWALVCLLVILDSGLELDLAVNLILASAVLVILLVPHVRRYYTEECGIRPVFDNVFRADTD